MTAKLANHFDSRFGPDLDNLIDEVTAIRADVVADAAVPPALLAGVHPNFRDSAQNLLHYMALRRRDLRPLQLRLAALGLSSLGRAESHVLATLDSVLAVMHRIRQESWQAPPGQGARVDFARGERLLARHTETLVGPAAPGRAVRIMVTVPSEAADDETLIADLLQQGMECMRINCAHDEAPAWLRMIKHLKRAERAQHRSCRIMMDLAGPKLRTGPIEAGPAMIRIRPRRDAFGRVKAPAHVWLIAHSPVHALADPCLPVPAAWLERLRTGDRVKFNDVRDAKRVFVVVEVSETGCRVESSKTAYLVPGTVLRHLQRQDDRTHQHKAVVGALPRGENVLFLQHDDVLILTRNLEPGHPATLDSEGQVLTPATIGCTIPEVFDDVHPGEAIWFDDGRIGGVVEQVGPEQVLVRIRQTQLGGAKLRFDKGINLPDSKLRLGALTAKDIQDLPFVARHADVIELSFANSAQDVELLQQLLAKLGSHSPPLVMKIETQRGFKNLPEILLAAMHAPCCGVMIARGDLAVECGFERMAEVQEEILWMCEAAHVPVIWATQVLETLAKEGLPSRAEITDAAMSHRAECVMLNKGPYVLSALRVLDDILRRMQAHQTKKSAMLRELHLAHTLPCEVVETAQAGDQIAHARGRQAAAAASVGALASPQNLGL